MSLVGLSQLVIVRRSYYFSTLPVYSDTNIQRCFYNNRYRGCPFNVHVQKSKNFC